MLASTSRTSATARTSDIIANVLLTVYTINPLLGFRFWHHSSGVLDNHNTACFLTVSVVDGGVRYPRHPEHWNSPFTTSALTPGLQLMHDLFPKKYMYLSATSPLIPASLSRFVTLTNNMHSRPSFVSEPFGKMKDDPELQLLYSDTNPIKMLSPSLWSLHVPVFL